MSEKPLTDEDTGLDIIYFMRRGRPYLYLYDREAYRFVRMLRGIEVRDYEVVDYDPQEAKKGNPLYLDAVGIRAITPDMRPDLDAVEIGLEYKVAGKVSEYFGGYVTDELLEVSGKAYGSEVRDALKTVEVVKVRGKLRERETVNPNVWYWSLVWKHHKEDAPRSKEGVEIY